MAFDLFNSFDIDIPGLFNLLFQTNCSEQEHFLNDEKKTIVYYIYDSFIFAVQIPTLCLFFYENESQITLYLQCVGMLKKRLADFVHIVSSCAIYIAEEDLSPYTSSSCYHPPKYES